MDFSTAFADGDGVIVAQGLTLSGHLGAIPVALQSVNEVVPPAEKPSPVLPVAVQSLTRLFDESENPLALFSVAMHPISTDEAKPEKPLTALLCAAQLITLAEEP
ncbi:MAG: hypothetical protein ACK462_02875 [Planctomyces sp.]